MVVRLGLEAVLGVFNRAMAYGTPLLLATLGEVYAERAGVLNLGVEGMMMLGALGGFVVTYILSNPWVGILAGALMGGVFSLIHAFSAITLRANQTVSGLALTLLGTGIAGTLGRNWEGRTLATPVRPFSEDFLTRCPILLRVILKDVDVLALGGIVLAVFLWFFLFKTRPGLFLRSCGENPSASDTLGVNVWRVRYLAVFFGGVMAGLGGAYISVAYRPAWSSGMTQGVGWLAVALTIFSFWNPLYALVGAYLFGALFHLAFRLQVLIAPELLNSLPYLFPIVALVFVSRLAFRKKLGVPEALGKPYKRGKAGQAFV
ncbi:MAG: ABC transporter permease [Atribacterota bacterium]|nr:ABC transporter permease [Atribacterota bacterium]